MRPLPIAFCLCTALFALPAGAQTLKPAVPPKLTLAQALSVLPPPKDGLLLTVGAEKVTLPGSTDAPPAGASLPDIAAAFGEITPSFGSVTAVAPATMVLLNTQPDPPDLTKDLNAVVGLDMLTASLDDAQWKMLTSEHGLGLTDLTDETQRGLFHSLFNHGHLWIGSEDPALDDVPQEQRTDVRDVTDQIDGTRIRLGQTADIDLHDRKGKQIFLSGARPDAASRLHTYHPKLPPTPAEHAVTLRAATPNTPKTRDLDLDAKAFQVAVPITNLKTVGDLVTRIGLASGLELYADPHYAQKMLTITGTDTAATAEDLLQAVCLCVTGTFRKVGPAYVLTDDLIGIGIRRKHLQEWENGAMTAQQELELGAGRTMLEHRGKEARTLPTFGDPLAVTPEEMAMLPDMPGMPGVPQDQFSRFPFAKLTPAQKTWMRQVAADYDEKHHTDKLPFYLDGDDIDDADVTQNVTFDVDYQLQLLVPSVSIPVDTGLSRDLWLLFYSGDTPEARKDYAALEAKELAKLPPPPALSSALNLGRIRGVFGHPRTATDVDALVAAMQKLKLNALILDAYSDGVNHVAASGAHGVDILTEAVSKTRGTGIAVFADFSLLAWGAEPPDSLRDLTIDGKTSRQAAVEANSGKENENFDDAGNPVPFVAPPVRVSPAASGVQDTLAAAVRQIAAQPGLAGFVFEDADVDADLGYTPPLRLAFLRADHADPVDITQNKFLRADSTLPLFDDDTLDLKQHEQWTEFNRGADAALLRRLYAAAQPAPISRRAVLMEQDSFRDNWLASWDNSTQMPPPLRDLTPGVMFPSQEKVMRIARAQAKIVLRSVAVDNDADTVALSRKLSDDAKTLPGDGFVLSFKREETTQGTSPMDALVSAVAAEKAGTSK